MSYRNLDIQITKRETEFVFNGVPYRGKHKLTKATIARLDHLRETRKPPSEYGELLFQAVFPAGDVLGGIKAAWVSKKRSEGFRIRLNIKEPDLERLWWECLADVNPPLTLGRSTQSPLSRYQIRRRTRGLPADRLRVLVAIANPIDLGAGIWEKFPKLQEADERKAIAGTLQEIDDVDFKVLRHPITPGRIHDELLQGGYHVLHIVAHGTYDPTTGLGLLLEQDDRTAKPLSAKNFAGMFGNDETVQLVVLAACRSAWQSAARVFTTFGQELLQHGVPAVVAMQDPIDVKASTIFATKFYAALGRNQDDTGGMVDLAVNEARDYIFSSLGYTDSWDWAVPVLFLSGPGRLFRLRSIHEGPAPDRITRGAADAVAAVAPAAVPAAQTPQPDRGQERQDRQKRLRLAQQLSGDNGLAEPEVNFICRQMDPPVALDGATFLDKVESLLARSETPENDLQAWIDLVIAQRRRTALRVVGGSSGLGVATATTWTDLSKVAK